MSLRQTFVSISAVALLIVLAPTAIAQVNGHALAITIDSDQPLQAVEFDVVLPPGTSFRYADRPAGELDLLVSVVGDRLHVVTTVREGALRNASIILNVSDDGLSPNGIARAEHVIGVAPDRTPARASVVVEPLGSNSTVRRRVVQPPLPRPSSSTLIDEAAARGEISGETALIYKVFAAFVDSRLPQKYRGDDSNQGESPVIGEVASQMASLSQSARETLAPFFIPPMYAKSWAGKSNTVRAAGLLDDCEPVDEGKWAFIEAKGVPVRVWYPVDKIYSVESYAKQIADKMANKAYSKLTTLMGHSPLPDGGSTSGRCRGGSDALDIVLTEDEPNAKTVPYLDFGVTSLFNCTKFSAFILMGYHPKDGIVATSVHELMHAIQYGYPLKNCWNDYQWLAEATAQWAMDYDSPPADTGKEQRAAASYFKAPGQPLDSTENEHDYAAYVFFLFLTRTQDPTGADGRVISRIWDAAAFKGSREAVDSSISGGFAQKWPEFALALWNPEWEPLNKFRTWDGLSNQPEAGGGNFDGINTEGPFTTATIKHLSTHYEHFFFSNSKNRSVLFANGLTYKLTREAAPKPEWGKVYTTRTIPDDEKKGVKIQALIKIAGQNWKIEKDWGEKPYRAFCRDVADQNIEELVLIVSDSEIDKNHEVKPKDLKPRIFVSDLGCKAYKGTITSSIAGATVQSMSSVAEDVNFTTTDNTGDPGVGPAVGYVYHPSGTITWNWSGLCTGQTKKPLAQTDGQLRVFNFVPPGEKANHKYSGAGLPASISMSVLCKGVVAPTTFMGTWWQMNLSPDEVLMEAKSDGQLSGRFAPGGDNADWTWDLKPQK